MRSPGAAAWQMFDAQGTAPLPPLDRWTGDFCIPDALPGIPYGRPDCQPDPRGRIWPPAYGCYDAFWRAKIRWVYKQLFKYTHFPYNCAGLPYRDHYPELADDPARVARDLAELEADGIIPVVCATDDRRGGVIAESFIANGDRIKVCFPMWEQNGGLTTEQQQALILATRAAAPQAHCYLHFTPEHGSISSDEAAGWRWCQDVAGTTGLLAQGSNDFPPGDPQVEGRGLESTAIRLAGRTDLGAPPSWAGMHQLTVKFEYGIYGIYNGAGSSGDQIAYTKAFLRYCPTVVGFCDGGPA